MDIALITHDYPPIIFGGIGNFAFELAKGLSHRGVNVHVITGHPEDISSIGTTRFQRVMENAVDVIRLPYPSIPPRHTIFQAWNFKRISKIIQSLDVDVIHGQSGCTYPLVKNLNKNAPVLVTFHGSALFDKIASSQSIFRGGTIDDFSKFFLGYPAWHMSYKKELQYSNAVITVSKALKSEILIEMGKKYENKIQSIHNGVDLQSLDKDYCENTDGIDESEEKILFAGRLYWRKGASNVIRMAYLLQKRNTNFKIIVHGTGPLFGKMQQSIKALGLTNVQLKGFTSKRELIKSLKSCKFVLIPSFYEACPMTLLEGMCLGKIPLMLKLPFSSELTQEGKYGILGDGMVDLTNQVITLKNSHLLPQFSNDIRAFARNAYCIEKITGQYLEVYKNLV
ncbi:MAG: glycosyltransferase family 4 protein [Candidatus Bathyarchaeota archaeon]|nr:glycosyltransferase family 4 protein [Candidatus Bathyarchaeota archaeon]